MSTKIYTNDRIKFTDEKPSYKVQATSKRFAVCTRPFNPQRTVIYTVIDWEQGVRGTENLVLGFGAETKEQCLEMVIRLLDGVSEVSHRNRVPLSVEWIDDANGNRRRES